MIKIKKIFIELFAKLIGPEFSFEGTIHIKDVGFCGIFKMLYYNYESGKFKNAIFYVNSYGFIYLNFDCFMEIVNGIDMNEEMSNFINKNKVTKRTSRKGIILDIIPASILFLFDLDHRWLTNLSYNLIDNRIIFINDLNGKFKEA